MKNKKAASILFSFFTAFVVCLITIVLINYIYGAENSFNLQKKEEQSSIEGLTFDDVEEETTIDINTIPLNERLYTVDEKVYTNQDIFAPCESYNRAIMEMRITALNDAFPPYVVSYMLDKSGLASYTRFISELNLAFKNAFGNSFNFKNTLVNTTVLTDNDIDNMNHFFKDTYNYETDIQYAVLVETLCTIESITDNEEIESEDYSENESSTPPSFNFIVKDDTDDTNNSGNDKTDPEKTTEKFEETEYFISYYVSGKWYIDYDYMNYLMYN